MEHSIYRHKGQNPPLGRMAYFSFAFMLGSATPNYKAIDTRSNIVKLHCGIGIYTLSKIEHTMHNGHDSTHHPQPDVSLVFEPQVQESKGCAYALQY